MNGPADAKKWNSRISLTSSKLSVESREGLLLEICMEVG